MAAGSNNLLDKIKNKLEFSKRNGKALTGDPADEIVVHGASGVNKYVKEEAEKKAVFTFGRFNPPTTGHQKLVDAVKNMAEKQGAEHHVFASHSQDKAKNPLNFDEKVGFMKKMFPKTNVHSSHSVKNVLDAAKHLQAKGVTHGTLVVGSDRVDEFHNLLSKYNKNPADQDYDPKKHFYIPHLNVVSAGHRDPDAEGVEGMSASKMRAHATAGNFNEFKKGVPNQAHAQSMYDTLRQRMGIKESIDEQSSGLLNTTGTRTPQELRTMKTDRLRDKIDSKLKSKLDAKKAASAKEDEKGRKIAKTYKTVDTHLPSDMTQNPYEETRYNIPMDREGEPTVDVGMDKDLESNDVNNQLKRRKAMKRFKQMVEGNDGDVAYSDKPSAFGQLDQPAVSQPVPKVKQRIKNVEAKPVSEDHDDESGMAKNQLDTVIRGAKELKSKIKDKKDLPAWVQSKITKGEDQIDTVADYMKSEEKRGLWANIHAKRERIKAGSGERMRTPGSKGAPTSAGFRSAQEEVDLEEKIKPEYRAGLSDSTAKAREAHWKKMAKYSDKDPRAYQPAPGDATAKTKPSKHTIAYHDKFGESIEIDEASETGLAAKAKKSGVSLSTLKTVYRRGVAAWNSGHRPGTTPQQWGMARVNSYITKGKGTYHGADKDLHEEELIVERGADSKGYFRSTESGAGLTKKGVAHFRAQNPGSKLQSAVTGKVKPGSKAAKRRKSFCARMSGMPGPMKDEKGRPTRKAMSLRRWRCR